MKTTPNNYDYVLSMYVSDDILRPAMCKVFKQENLNIATDSYSVIYVDDTKPGFKYEEDDKAPNAINLLKNFTFDRTENLNRDSLLSNYLTLGNKWSKKYKPCDKCEGYGEVECTCCGNDSECEDCDGTGESNEVESFTIPTLSGDKIKLFDRKIGSTFLHRVIQSAFFLGVENFTVKFNSENTKQAFLFEIDSAKIIVMPTL